ncbi:MAG: efflux RND transporter periplasmic adaptor subunit [Ginsengibacter sp.]
MKKTFLHTGIYLIIAAFLVSCGENKKQTIPTKTNTIDTLDAFVVTQQPVNKIASLPSQLAPFEKAELFAKIPGYVKTMKVDIGDHVKAGQVLAIMEAAENNANLLESISSAQAAQAKYQTSKDYYDRLVNAAKEPGAVAESELIRAKNQMNADNSASLAAKQASQAYSQISGYLTLKAPFAGVITQRNADPGNLVSSSNAKPLLILEKDVVLRLKVPVPETYMDAASQAKKISFTVDAIPGKSFTANLYRKSNTIDLTNRTELWEFLVKNDDKQLRSGMYVTVNLPLQRKQPSLVVPYSAVATTLEKKFVIKYHNGQTEWVDVRNGINMDSTIEIFGDLMPGDTLLKKGTDEVKSGTKVAIQMQ